MNPKCLHTGDSSKHSPILGFAFDGFPVYGPYGYSSANNTQSSITRMKSSYKLRNIQNRTTLSNGTVLAASDYGPPVNSTYPLGSYVEDYEYSAGYGDLDSSNGRVCITPEYPNGIFAYFVTIDSNGTGEYPFIIGTYFYGNVETANYNYKNMVISETVTTYFTCRASLSNYQNSLLNTLLLLFSYMLIKSYL